MIIAPSAIEDCLGGFPAGPLKSNPVLAISIGNIMSDNTTTQNQDTPSQDNADASNKLPASNDTISIPRYIFSMQELACREETKQAVMEKYGKDEHLLKDNIDRYLKPTVTRVRKVYDNIENVIDDIEVAMESPEDTAASLKAAKRRLNRILKSIEGFVNPMASE